MHTNPHVRVANRKAATVSGVPVVRVKVIVYVMTAVLTAVAALIAAAVAGQLDTPEGRAAALADTELDLFGLEARARVVRVVRRLEARVLRAATAGLAAT